MSHPSRRVIVGRVLGLTWGFWVSGSGRAEVTPHPSAADPPPNVAESTISLGKPNVVRFLSARQAEGIIGRTDRFVQAMSPLDRQLRMHSEAAVTPEQFLSFAQQQTLDWQAEEQSRLARLLHDVLEPKLARYGHRLPREIQLIKTTGAEEGGAAYCRPNTIVLPQRVLQSDDEGLARLLTHELFHVISQQSVELRRRMYLLLGAELNGPLNLPAELAANKLTNPDAPETDVVIHLTHQGTPVHITPILIARNDASRPASERTLFGEVTLRLVEVVHCNRAWQIGDAPQHRSWLAEELPEYASRIGRNTNYILHPEEVLADNFVHLVWGTQNLVDPTLTARLGETLQSSSTTPESP